MNLGHLLRAVPYGFMTLVCAVIAIPFYWLVSSSLKSTRELFTSPFGLPAQPQWQNYLTAWQTGVGGFVLNSVLVTTLSVIGIILVSGMAAYAVARLRFPGRIGFYLLLITGYAVPIHTVIVPLYEILRRAGLLNTYIGLIAPYIAFGIPFSVLLLYSFFLEFPGELEDAAVIDGCNTWQTLRWIVAPLSLPGISTVAIFQGVFIWNEFLLALVFISDRSRQTLPVGLATFQGQYASNWPVMLAAIALATLPPLMLYVVLQRHFINSLTGFAK